MSRAEHPLDEMIEAQNRFIELHYRAACVRVDSLGDLLQAMEAHGPLSPKSQHELEDAITAATDILESLRAIKQRLAPTEMFSAVIPRPRSRLQDPSIPPASRRDRSRDAT